MEFLKEPLTPERMDALLDINLEGGLIVEINSSGNEVDNARSPMGRIDREYLDDQQVHPTYPQ